MVVAKRIQSSYNQILRAKIYFFFKRSIWRYLLGMFILGFVCPLNPPGAIISALIYFLIFIVVILIPVYHFSSKIMEKRIAFDADVEFNKQNIIIKHRNKDLEEVKEWTWIKQIDITGKAVFLIVNQPNQFAIILNNNNLSENELQFFSKIKSERLR
ncbi:MAG: hypothetical protein JWR38_738 [Mucilaginibacter sp.]|nr:hypothetical protein [Mucilaginibacter sp.]